MMMTNLHRAVPTRDPLQIHLQGTRAMCTQMKASKGLSGPNWEFEEIFSICFTIELQTNYWIWENTPDTPAFSVGGWVTT